MSNASFIALVSWVITHGYPLFFVAAFLEGPLVTSAAGVASSLGYFNIIFIILLSIAADLVADLFFFILGYFGGRPVVEKYGYLIGLTKDRLEKLDEILMRHMGKAVVFFKLSPLIPVPGIILVGTSRPSLKRFVTVALSVTIPKSIFFALLGFYTGKAYNYLSGTIISARNATFILGLLFIAVYYLYKKISKRIAGRYSKGS
ncbi:VTT domain-containing protein [Patescibacteria group bacterium]|nr:VTT domain-containing protein [Patescibacteria group bacterium]